MALSDTYILNVQSLIEAAYRKLGIPGEDGVITAYQREAAQEAFAATVALAQTDGFALWKRVTIELIPSITSQVYPINGAAKIINVYLKEQNGTQYELQNRSYTDLLLLPSNTTGTPVSWSWDQSLIGGGIRIWPLRATPSDVATKRIVVVYQAEFDAAQDLFASLDFPVYWGPAFIYKMAQMLAPEIGLSLEDRNRLEREADTFWKKASDYGDDVGSLFIVPDTRWK